MRRRFETVGAAAELDDALREQRALIADDALLEAFGSAGLIAPAYVASARARLAHLIAALDRDVRDLAPPPPALPAADLGDSIDRAFERVMTDPPAAAAPAT